MSTTLYIPDCHIPYEDRRAFRLVLKVIDATRPDNVCVLGDFSDFSAVAQHPKKFGRRQAFMSELNTVKARAREVLSASRKARIVWVQGNHCESYERYVAKNAPELEELLPSGATLFGLPDHVEWVNYREHTTIGNVLVTHDVGFSGKHAAAATLDATQRCTVFGHTHRGAISFGGNVENHRAFAMNAGWLGDKSKITYMHAAGMRDWQAGFGWTRSNKQGLTWPTFVPIVNYKCILEGNEYSV